MTRTRASAKAAGSSFESLIANGLATMLDDDRIERRTKNGNKDRGDITGVKTIRGGRVVLEAKDYGGQVSIGPWLKECAIEVGNDDAAIGAVVAKRRGTTDPGQQIVIMTLADFAHLLLGGAPDLRGVENDGHVVTA